MFKKTGTLFVFAITLLVVIRFEYFWQFGSQANLQLTIAYLLKSNCRCITLGQEPA